MKVFIITVLGIIGVFPSANLSFNNQQARSTEKTITCSYNPQSGKPNPLGMRTFITATEKDNNSIFVYERFPSMVSGDRPVTIENKRTLILYQTKIEEAISILRENSNYYSELVGYQDNEGFTKFDGVFQCK